MGIFPTTIRQGSVYPRGQVLQNKPKVAVTSVRQTAVQRVKCTGAALSLTMDFITSLHLKTSPNQWRPDCLGLIRSKRTIIYTHMAMKLVFWSQPKTMVWRWSSRIRPYADDVEEMGLKPPEEASENKHHNVFVCTGYGMRPRYVYRST